MTSSVKIEFGDFQTPSGLAIEVCLFLKNNGISPGVVMEPTCGLGAFLLGAAKTFPQAKLLGWDINPEYVEQARQSLDQVCAPNRASVSARDFFKHDWKTELAEIKGNLLILGNLPWVTNARVSSLNGANLPEKSNFQGFRGIEARTGKSNFDISEWMLICLIECLRGRTATIAMLCKTATARKVLRYAWQKDGRVCQASIYHIDAKAHFEAAVDACLLLLNLGIAGVPEAKIYKDFYAADAIKTMGLAGRDLVADTRSYHALRHLEGFSPYQWRSGVKHDCASVMELWIEKNNYRNKLGEEVELEPDFLYPLLKCSDLANGRTHPERLVLLTQSRPGEDTSAIARKAPRTWDYLQKHAKLFQARKSSIYAKQDAFALFGIGDYSFAPWKVAVSGLHKKPRFVVVGQFEEKPVMFDDACYFLPFQNEEEARVVADVLNSVPCQTFLAALTFEDSKRPIKVELLQRLNLYAVAEEAGLSGEWAACREKQGIYSIQKKDQAEFVMETHVSDIDAQNKLANNPSLDKTKKTVFYGKKS